MSYLQTRPGTAVSTQRQARHPLRRLCAGLIGLMLALGAARAQASPFVLDSAHTSAHFAASHFDRTLVRGRFIGITGQLDFDPVLHSGTLDVNIDPDTVDTGLRGLDTVLKSAQFFDTKEYPIVRFQSTQFTFEGGRLHTIAGQLTLHGVTLPVQLQADRFSCGEVKLLVLRRHVCGGDFHVTILRSAFGLRSFLPDVSDAVRIDIAAEASPSN